MPCNPVRLCFSPGHFSPHLYFPFSEGETIHVLANELVPGDLVQFSTGDRIPADIRVSDAIDLEIDESSLTGETTARRKSPEVCLFDQSGGYNAGQPHGEPVALADRTCIGYMGTLVRNGEIVFVHLVSVTKWIIGRGTGIVIATGTETEFGVIFSMMQDVSAIWLISINRTHGDLG